MSEDGVLHPKFDISDVVFQLHKSDFKVDVTGDAMPLYKESKIEREIKEWFDE